jgi:hypothetical protein
MRTVAAILVAPLAVIPILLLLFGPWAMAHGGARTLSGILEPALIVAYPLVILCGLPMHLALAQQRLTQPRHYALAGALLGAVPVIAYLIVAVVFEAKFSLARIPMALARNVEWGTIGAAVFGLCGSAIALTFRLLAGKPAGTLAC